MRIALYMILITSMLVSFYVQAEPKVVNTKAEVDKIDRSELETHNETLSLDNIVPKLEMPNIEFDGSIRTRQNTTTSVPANKSTAKKEPTKKKPVKQKNKKKIVLARKSMLLNQLNKGDKILLSKGLTYVFRISRHNITQYLYKGKLAMDSSGLEPSKTNGYYIIDKDKLVADTKLLNSNKKASKVTRHQSSSKAKQLTKRKTITTNKLAKKPASNEPNIIPVDIIAQRKKIEKEYNKGKAIKNSIRLKNLRANDKIHIIDNIQLVFRKNTSTSGVKKYWLTEKLNPDNKAIKLQSKNIYKVIKLYRPD
ncbi:hypothetical protein MNBD_GAMMA01-262 [hydrothermal vent metagenome]|uniref:Uncharacterized protein n=1 Tax=hydrothermal vent metagenome TaxID=652676 RepID=A0A3B0VCS9_9ZZZZ